MSLVTRFLCSKCGMLFAKYDVLLEHLYWRHGTEGNRCQQCKLKQWSYAEHQCHVLPGQQKNDSQSDKAIKSFCYCGNNKQEPMIGCDGPHCKNQWYHFSCLSIGAAPAGEWYCPDCTKFHTQMMRRGHLIKI